MAKNTTTPVGTHCNACGSTDAEDVSNLYESEGYTRCCNKRTCDGANCTASDEYGHEEGRKAW